MFTEKDKQQIKALGLTLEQVERQLSCFSSSFPSLSIIAPATLGNGIIALSLQQQRNMLNRYEAFSGSVLKFVPASGAATRMFQPLFTVRNTNGLARDSGVNELFERIEEFAFYGQLAETLKNEGYSVDTQSAEGRLRIAETILGSKGLGYEKIPKALVSFHKYADEVRTALEEHLVEAAFYTTQPANIHFTISADYKDDFSSLSEGLKPKYEQRFGIVYDVSFSEQKSSTNTIAVNLDNTPFRNSDGSLLFRPGGHGALLHNLNKRTEELIFIKNVDNVVPETKVSDTVYWKRVLGGLLLSCRDAVYRCLTMLENGDAQDFNLSEVEEFLYQMFGIIFPKHLQNEERTKLVYAKLNRPIRVCGMVKNEGEPGGGPFIVADGNGVTSLQILESSQLNLGDERTAALASKASHFNPVDIVCSTYNHRGEKYNLYQFTDPDTGFIAEKTEDGRPLKALELPGLWNGAMSDWNTVFVEVPLSTFNPVKVVNDLLRNEHLV